MRYTRFEDLPVWNSAIELAVQVYDLTERIQFRRRYSLRDQLERAAVSVSNNIAEGFERGTNNELLSFLYIARGSAGEVRSMLCLMERLPALRELGPPIRPLKAKAESCSRQLRVGHNLCKTQSTKASETLIEKPSVLIKQRASAKSF
jgi:four helix bundle protein